MSKESMKLPGIGLRNIKTALGVFLCILLYGILQRPYAFFACISVVICLSNTMESSYQTGKERMISTAAGGLLGIPFLYFKNSVMEWLSFQAVEAVVVSLGIVLLIYLFNLLGLKGAIVNACVVFLSVVINLSDTQQLPSPFMYAVNRIIDNAAGIVVALAVNKYCFPVKGESCHGAGQEERM